MDDLESPHDGLPRPRRYWAGIAIALTAGLSVLDASTVNVALPTLAHDFSVSAADAIWVVAAFQLALAVSLLPLASLGEIIGFRRLYTTGLAIFVVSSIACAVAGSLPMLVAARIAEGLGAACMLSINPALVRLTYPAAELGRAIGVNGVVISVATAAGPTLGGAILTFGDWRWLFGLNVPIGLVCLIIAAVSLPASARADRRLDAIGVGLNASGFGLLIGGLQAVAHGVGLLRSGLMMAGGALAGAILVAYERRRPSPLIPLDLFADRTFALSVTTSVVAWTAQIIAFIVLPFFLHLVMHRSVVEMGLLMTTWPLAALITGPLAGWLSDRYPVAVLAGVGLALFAIGGLAVALVPSGATWPDITWRMVLFGAGFGFFQAPNNRALLLSAPLHRSGAAGGALGMSRTFGQAIGAAAAAFVLHVAPIEGLRPGLGLAAAVAFVGVFTSLARLKPSSARSLA